MKIVVPDDYTDAIRQLIGLERFGDHEVVIYTDPTPDPAEHIRRMRAADALLLIQQRSFMPRETLEELTRLRFIVQTGRGTAHLDLETCNRMGITVSAGSGGHGSSAPTAQLAWALILAAARDLPRQAARLKAGNWLNSTGMDLEGRTLGIYAFGNIGSLVAKAGAAFGMRIVCFGREGSTARARAVGYEVAESREAFFASADVLSLHLPLNAETRGIVTAADLARMKPTSLLVNTSRAAIVAPVLYDALKAGRPGYAAVDVYEKEPVLSGLYSLLSLPNALCTPHLGYSTADTYRNLLGYAIDSIRAYADGRPRDVITTPVERPRGSTGSP